ncbi:MAG: DUF4112 domain-containing protein [Pseudomonadota bacterium]
MDRPTEQGLDSHHALNRMRWLADLFDDRFRLPGTERRFGLDGILGLFPAVGDVISGVISLYLAAEGLRFGMPFSRLLRMGFNVVVDMTLGAIPLIGDLFDFAWKANQKNVRIVLEHLESDIEAKRSRR